MGQLIYEELETYKGECTVTELLYVYLDNIRCFKDNAFTFTSEYEITYDKKAENVLGIKKIDSNVPENFFGDNISNINLIVGQNGSGKSTLLSIFNYSEADWYLLENMIFSGWFLVYKTETDGVYCIDGYNLSYINININQNLNHDMYKSKRDSNKYILIYNDNNKTFYLPNDTIEFPNIVYKKEKKINGYVIDKEMKDYPTNIDKSDVFKKREKNAEITPNSVGRTYKRLFEFLSNNKKYMNIITRKGFNLYINMSYTKNDYDSLKNILKKYIAVNEGLFNGFDDFSNEDSTEDYFENETKYKKILKTVILIKIIIILYNHYPEINSKNKKDKLDLSEKCSFEFNSELKDETELNLILCKLYCAFCNQYIRNHIRYDEYPSQKENLLDVVNLLKKIDEFIDCYFKLKKSLSIRSILLTYLDNDIKSVVINKSYGMRVQIRFDINDEFEELRELNEDINKTMTKYLQYMDEIITFFECLTFKNFDMFEVQLYPIMSDGEWQSISIYNYMFNTMNDKKKKYQIILCDEPDKGFHPQWISEFIKEIVEKTNENKFNKFQFIITTHSPFMLSDIPKEYISKIEIKTDDEGKVKCITSKASHSFASNYYDLINDSFFLDSTLGKFASKKINEILINILNADRAYSRINNKFEELYSNIHGYVDINDEEINNWLNIIYKDSNKDELLKKWIVSQNCNRVSNESFIDLMEIVKNLQMSDSEKKSIKEKLDIYLANIIIKKFNSNYSYLKSLTNVIDEPFIRTSLNSELDRVYDLIQTSNVSPNSIDNEIKRLEKRIEKLKVIQEKQNDKVK